MRRWLLLSFTAALIACPDRGLDRAEQALAAGRFDEAGEAYLNLARRDPAMLAAWDGAIQVWCVKQVRIGRCLEVLDLEIQKLGVVARHQKVLTRALASRAEARLRQGLFEAAASDLDRAENAGPPDAWVLRLRAEIWMAKGDPVKARAALKDAAELEPDHPDLRRLLDALPEDEGFGAQPAP